MAAQLQHPHVVPVLASGDADGLPGDLRRRSGIN